MDDIWAVIHSWGHRYLIEGGLALLFLLFLHFIGYPYIVRRAELTAAHPKPVSALKPSENDGAEASGGPEPQPQIVLNTPQGIAIGGNNSGSATVNNHSPAPLSMKKDG
jgi:hypothetical protein